MSLKPLDLPCVLLAGAIFVFSCTKQEAIDATKVSIAIACAIEHAELSDAELDKICGLTQQLASDIQPALAAHRKVLAKKTYVIVSVRDAGAD